jgi:hypothetical protein
MAIAVTASVNISQNDNSVAVSAAVSNTKIEPAGQTPSGAPIQQDTPAAGEASARGSDEQQQSTTRENQNKHKLSVAKHISIHYRRASAPARRGGRSGTIPRGMCVSAIIRSLPQHSHSMRRNHDGNARSGAAFTGASASGSSGSGFGLHTPGSHGSSSLPGNTPVRQGREPGETGIERAPAGGPGLEVSASSASPDQCCCPLRIGDQRAPGGCMRLAWRPLADGVRLTI